MLAFTILFGCGTNTDYSGAWQGLLQLEKNNIPFTFHLDKSEGKWDASFINSKEVIHITDIIETKDSLFINMGIFDTQFRLKKLNGTLSGTYLRNYESNYQILFKAIKSTKRFENANTSNGEFTGRWKVIFTDEDGSFPAIGIFKSNDTTITGTFITETGDYRYLEGIANEKFLQLSTFDGSHAFLFEAELVNDTLSGGFWSGNHYYASWSGVRDDYYSLRSADSLTFLKDGFKKIDFTFLNEEGDSMRLADLIGRPTIIQLLGTWCPNCMDETKFLVEWLAENPDKNINVIGLAYEYGDSPSYAYKRINKLKSKLQVPYPIVYAGAYDKLEAAKTLPILNAVISFPTLIFLDKTHDIKRIHTGFTGPGTGHYFEDFKIAFQKTIQELN